MWNQLKFNLTEWIYNSILYFRQNNWFAYVSLFNRGADPNQHILDTLEQCISVIIEKMQNLPEPEKGGSRLSSLDYSRTNDGKNNSFSLVSG